MAKIVCLVSEPQSSCRVGLNRISLMSRPTSSRGQGLDLRVDLQVADLVGKVVAQHGEGVSPMKRMPMPAAAIRLSSTSRDPSPSSAAAINQRSASPVSARARTCPAISSRTATVVPGAVRQERATTMRQTEGVRALTRPPPARPWRTGGPGAGTGGCTRRRWRPGRRGCRTR